MGWTRLTLRATDEAKVQRVFDAWGGNRADCTLAGVPAWLEALGTPLPREGFKREGYTFRPDVRWETHVAELKCGAKYEPLALGEALHHAQCLSMQENVPIIPIVIASYSAWLRRALQFLLERGFSQEHIKYLELNHLTIPGTEEHFIWFDAPFAAWQERDDVPDCLPKRYRDAGVSWYHVAETNSWFAAPQPSARPLIPIGPMIALAPISDGRFLFWQGHYDRGPDEYFLYDRATPTQSAPTPIFER